MRRYDYSSFFVGVFDRAANVCLVCQPETYRNWASHVLGWVVGVPASGFGNLYSFRHTRSKITRRGEMKTRHPETVVVEIPCQFVTGRRDQNVASYPNAEDAGLDPVHVSARSRPGLPNIFRGITYESYTRHRASVCCSQR
jgi:hypothetical protein